MFCFQVGEGSHFPQQLFFRKESLYDDGIELRG
jgi:hypothetical protein